MEKFDQLISLIQKLIGPEGCPWDQQQTMIQLVPDLIEETHEFIEAVNHQDNSEIEEELGDLFFLVTFFGILAKKEKRFSLEDSMQQLIEKVIRRHPHVFGERKELSTEEHLTQWEEIKAKEKGKQQRTSALDGIPVSLPALTKSQKIIRKMIKNCYPHILGNKDPLHQHTAYNQLSPSHQLLTEKLWQILLEASQEGLDLEQSLRAWNSMQEGRFRKWESESHEGD